MANREEGTVPIRIVFDQGMGRMPPLVPIRRNHLLLPRVDVVRQNAVTLSDTSSEASVASIVQRPQAVVRPTARRAGGQPAADNHVSPDLPGRAAIPDWLDQPALVIPDSPASPDQPRAGPSGYRPQPAWRRIVQRDWSDSSSSSSDSEESDVIDGPRRGSPISYTEDEAGNIEEIDGPASEGSPSSYTEEEGGAAEEEGASDIDWDDVGR